jgi:hypothetical protein
MQEDHADPLEYVRAWCDIQTQRYIQSFTPMTNLEYLEWKYEQKEITPNVSLHLRSFKEIA